MTNSVQPYPAAPSVKLTREEWQLHKQVQKDQLEKVQQERDDAVYKQLNETFQQEMYQSSFDPLVCYNEAKAIIELLYGEFHSTPLPDELSQRIALARSLYDKLVPPTFPKTTFILFLWGLGVACDHKFSMPGKFKCLAYDLCFFSSKHEEMMDNHWRSKAINPSDPATLNDLDIQKQLIDPNLSGPAKARLLRRFWPDVVERGLHVIDTFIDGSELHLKFQTFAEVGEYFSAHPTMTVLQFIQQLGIDHLAQDVSIRTEMGLQPIDLKWRRHSAEDGLKPSAPPPVQLQYPTGTIPPISLLSPASWSPYLTPRQIKSFQSCECSPSEKVRLLKILWAKIPEVGLIVPYIPSTLEEEGILIDVGFITFPQEDIPILETFFAANPSWSAWTFANLLGFCLRHKQDRYLGCSTYTRDPAQEVNYWIASKIRTVGQVVKNMERVWAAWKDEDLVFEPRQHSDLAA